MDLPMEEAVKYWQGRIPMSEGEFDSLSDMARTKAFFMAGLAHESMIREVYEKMGKALTEGKSFQAFKKDMADIADKSGWGSKERNYRLRTAFNTNILQAYSVGRYAQMTNDMVRAARPYWQYDAVDDGRTRPAHRALDQKVYRSDDAVWDTIYPPNGFNCRCLVRALSDSDVARRGLTVESGSGVVGSIGEVDGRPVAIVPDPGWAHNPGKVQWGDPLERKLIREMSDFRTESMTRATDGLATLPDPVETMLQPSGDVKSEWDRVMQSLGGGIVVDPMGRPVRLSQGLYDYVFGDRKAQQGRPLDPGRHRFVRGIVPCIERPDEIRMSAEMYTDGRVVLRKSYIKRFKDGDAGGVKNVLFVAEAQSGQWVGYNHMPIKKAASVRRRGVLLYTAR